MGEWCSMVVSVRLGSPIKTQVSRLKADTCHKWVNKVVAEGSRRQGSRQGGSPPWINPGETLLPSFQVQHNGRLILDYSFIENVLNVQMLGACRPCKVCTLLSVLPEAMKPGFATTRTRGGGSSQTPAGSERGGEILRSSRADFLIKKENLFPLKRKCQIKSKLFHIMNCYARL